MSKKTILTLTIALFLANCIERPEESYQVTEGAPVVAECFTSTICTHCPEAESALLTIAQSDTCFYPIFYHLSTSDPFYRADSEDINEIVNFYFAGGLHGTPTTIFNGNINFEGTSAIPVWPEIVDSLHHIERAISAAAYGEFCPDERQGWIFVEITGDIPTSLVIRGLVLESDIRYDAPNGDTIFDNVVRGTFPQPLGIEADSEGTYCLPFTIDSGITVENADIIVLIQDYETRSIEWAVKLPVSEMPEPQPQYSFEFHPEDTVIHVPPNSMTLVRLYLRNTGTLEDIYLIEVNRDSLSPEKWTVSLCREVCLPVLYAYDTLAPGEIDTNYTVDFFHTKADDPPGFVTVRVTSLSDTSLVDSARIWVYPQK